MILLICQQIVVVTSTIISTSQIRSLTIKLLSVYVMLYIEVDRKKKSMFLFLVSGAIEATLSAVLTVSNQ